MSGEGGDTRYHASNGHPGRRTGSNGALQRQENEGEPGGRLKHPDMGGVSGEKA